MPAALVHRDARPGPFLASRRLLWDVKITFGDSRYQGTQWVRERQSGEVASRALGVWPDYLAHARVLDERFSMPDTTPIQDCLLGYSRVRALVFGRYGVGV